MAVTAEDWDARVDGLVAKLPAPVRTRLDRLREPERLWLRLAIGFLFVLGGVFSILPVLGLWMLPVGLALLAQDMPGMKVPLERIARGLERAWQRITRWRR